MRARKTAAKAFFEVCFFLRKAVEKVFFSKKRPKKEREKSLFLFTTYFILRFVNTLRTTRSVLVAQKQMISLLPGSSSSSFTSLSSSNNAKNALFKRRQQQQQQQRNGRTIRAVSFLRSHYFFTTNTNENASNNNTNNNNDNNNRRRRKRRDALLKVVRATKEDKKSSTAKEVDEITKKWGLEAGLWKIFKSSEKNNSSTNNNNNNNKTGGEGEGAQQLSGSRMDMAKQLLKTYGSAYLITSISLSLVSFGVFYVLVSSGVDVAALLSVIGITATQNSEKVGTVAIAYAAHKAASPIRFPPTVALTPIVAGWMGKTGNKGEEEEEDGEGGEEK